MKQVRIPISDLPKIMLAVSFGTMTWADAMTTYPEQIQSKEEEKTDE